MLWRHAPRLTWQGTTRGEHYVPAGPGLGWVGRGGGSGEIHGKAHWSCALHVLTLGRTDLLGNWNAWPLGTSFLQWFV